MNFRNPIFLILFLIIPLIFYLRRQGKKSYVRFSSGQFLTDLGASFKQVVSKHLLLLRLVVIVFLIFAVMRPRAPIEGSKVKTEGVDIVLAMDCSTSMLAEDFKLGGKRRNRLDVVKEVVSDFIKKRKNDRIGIVAFAARAYTICPLTLDYSWLLQNLERVKIGIIEDGTAVGSGIAASVNRLKDSEAKSKIVVLLTDGRNNAGKINPSTAAEAAKAINVKVYTVGAGTKGIVPFPAQDIFGRKVYQNVDIDLDEGTLKKIAEVTNANYYRATDTESLRTIYDEIDQLEKTPVEEKGYLEYNELFSIFTIIALIILVLEIVLTNTVFMKLP
jgi:Ca-activated chloride channel family protein